MVVADPPPIGKSERWSWRVTPHVGEDGGLARRGSGGTRSTIMHDFIGETCAGERAPEDGAALDK